MKYVALLSGGKDSCFNLLHCSQNGHELVAAASLGPQEGKEELDSYLYQTVGQDAIQFVARALDVPLYRQIITRNAVNQGAEYGARTSKDGVAGDETEDLYDLLSTVKLQHPDIQGVSVGAILSNYQRVRVEHVCRRLSLTCLSYLWQRSQNELLSEMIDTGLNAILIKVAGIGLTVKHLGKNLGEMKGTLLKLHNLYGSHTCGEGGEYETLTLDCPLFKSQIVLHDVETVIHSDHDFATVAFIRIKSATLEPKSVMSTWSVPAPPLLSDPFVSIEDTLQFTASSELRIPLGTDPDPELFSSDAELSQFPTAVCRKIGSWVSVTNIQVNDSKKTNTSIEDEVIECFHILRDRLSEHSLQLANCTNINIFLSSMVFFTQVNAAYSSFFGTSPPARACVALDLPHSPRVQLDCVAYAEDEATANERQALHVQGLSYWAPANIGPYSQAIIADQCVFISGQIGMVPSSLFLPSPRSLSIEAALSMQHVDRILESLRTNSGGWGGYSLSNIYWLAAREHIPRVKQGHEVYRVQTTPSSASPTLFVAVKALPKDALVEKQAMWHTGRFAVVDEDDGTTSLQPISVSFLQETLSFQHVSPGSADFSINGLIEIEISQFDGTPASCTLISGKGLEHRIDIFPDVTYCSDEYSPRYPTCCRRPEDLKRFKGLLDKDTLNPTLLCSLSNFSSARTPSKALPIPGPRYAHSLPFHCNAKARRLGL